MKNSIKYIKQGQRNLTGTGLGSYTGYVAVRNEEEVLCLVGSIAAYCPSGGKKVLKEIIETTKEGETFFWKKIKN